MKDENKNPSNEPEKSVKETNSSGDLTLDKTPEAGSSNTKETDNISREPHSQAEAMTSVEELSAKIIQCKIDGVCAAETANEANGSGKTKSGPQPIVISIVLKMAEIDHKALLEEWISSRTS